MATEHKGGRQSLRSGVNPHDKRFKFPKGTNTFCQTLQETPRLCSCYACDALNFLFGNGRRPHDAIVVQVLPSVCEMLRGMTDDLKVATPFAGTNSQ